MCDAPGMAQYCMLLHLYAERRQTFGEPTISTSATSGRRLL
jgi:hypothetical protein